MRPSLRDFTVAGLTAQAVAALRLPVQPATVTTALHHIHPRVPQDTMRELRIAAIVPTEPGQIGINSPGPEPTPANIEGHTRYLTEEAGSTKWIGPDPSHIAVTTTMQTKKGGETAIATITRGVNVSKNAEGGVDILLSPAVKAKLEALAKDVAPCAKKLKRGFLNRKRQALACGLSDFVQKVGADEELRSSFVQPITDQAWREVDEGYESGDDPVQDPGWEGDGVSNAPGEDEGYFSDDGEGFFEGASGAEGEGMLETIVFSSGEEAANIGAALSGDAAAANAAIWGGGTVTAGSFLAYIWGHLRDGKAIPIANQIPKESIHKVTKTKAAATTSSSSGCPTSTGALCNPTNAAIESGELDKQVEWICTEGMTKDCPCQPMTESRISSVDSTFMQAVLAAFKAIETAPKEATIDCPLSISKVPSKFFVGQTSAKFCAQVMDNLASAVGPTSYDILGDEIPLLRETKAAKFTVRSLAKRTPPEKTDSFMDYRFGMEYQPKDGECLVPKEDLCKKAFDKLVKSNCGSNHGSLMDRMFNDASIYVGCGKFSWHVSELPKAPPSPNVGLRRCNDAYKHVDVADDVQQLRSEQACRYFESDMMKAGQAPRFYSPAGVEGAGTEQNYNISWVPGCETSAKEQNVMFPIEPNGVNCTTLMRDNYKICNNGGAGGYIDAGCVRYDFYPFKDPDGVIGDRPNESGGMIGKDPN
ncbi:Hypothetical protein D9617_2g059030 [Elsinoe fawcettii]|nr:Hypothetical protein D9617_2g059030 [Elsinoe fawcettii]